ncbi:RHS repeat domain-containing protein [Roseateles sp. UC29_93]|uniref:RHS repeat domain-containing protein n=1 Tax=Roseateles sp. UC29_93 TaxID=3350177 RepID=UPI00366A751F
MSDATRRFSAAKAFRCLLLAIGLGFFTLPAMAARDCWVVWGTDGILQWADDALQPLRFECKDTAAEAVAPVQGIAQPVLGSVTPNYTSSYQLSPAGCIDQGKRGGAPWQRCAFNYTGTTRWSDGRVTTSTGQTTVDLLMPCGPSLNTTPIGTSTATCKGILTRTPPGSNSCPAFGNPIEPLTGVKRQHEPLLTWGRGHSLSVTYVSRPKPESNYIEDSGAQSFGRWWSSNLHRQMVAWNVGSAQPLFQRGAGVWKQFPRVGASSDPSERDPTPRWSDTAPYFMLYRDEAARAIEMYREDGSLASIVYADGRRLDYTSVAMSSNGYPLAFGRQVNSIQDETGRVLSFQYVKIDDKQIAIQSLTDPAGHVLSMDYTAGGDLKELTFADLSSLGFVYEDTVKKHLLTGKIDETGQRLGTYAYDDAGRAVLTRTGSLAGWKVTWESQTPDVQLSEYYDPALDVVIREYSPPLPLRARVTAPDGRVMDLDSAVAGSATYLASNSQPAGSGCEAATSIVVHDLNGNATQRDDFNGNRSCMAYDMSRNLETSRFEGFTTATACEAVTDATLPAGARKVSSRWHPDWRLSTATAEPRRITTLIYNGQPDPFNGNAVASCAPTDALLPDGKPLVVLCKRVEQATTDETGVQGFNATPQSGVAPRATRWTYNATGQVLTETDPLNRVVVTNEYYADTTADHTKGDLKSSKNAAGHLTTFTRYDAYGNALEAIDANTSSTIYTYDPRQRLTSLTTAGATTTYEYWPTGLLKKSSQPDGSAVNYEYDDAHRLVAVSDTRGNRIDYALDANGNRTRETAKDPQGALKRTMSRTFDALGRAQQTTGRE